MSLVFYDTETTGTNKSFDQILQFAAVQTDDELNEIDSINIRCRLLPHIVPSPGAMNVTGVRVSRLVNPSLPSHYEMVRAIRAKLLSWAPAVFLGWNSMEFDEPLVRQALYKTLHNPYLTNSVGSTRSDVMRMAQASSILAPGALIIPLDARGQRTFRLDQLAPANGFSHDQAHDALGDVRATVFVSRLLKERAPTIWSSFMRFSKKASVIDYVTDESLVGLSEFHFGKAYSYVVTSIGSNSENPAELYVYDLNVDPETLRSLSNDELAARLRKSPKPVRRLKSNAAPMISSYDDLLENGLAPERSLPDLEDRAQALRSDTLFKERMVSAFQSGGNEYDSSPHVEMQIYGGFYEKADELLMEAFHAAEWASRSAIVEKFQDERLKVLGRRLIYHERPDLLDATAHSQHEQDGANRLLGPFDKKLWLTVAKALDEIDAMMATAAGTDLDFLQEHRQYLSELHVSVLRRGSPLQ